jgi:hypothetical protein
MTEHQFNPKVKNEYGTPKKLKMKEIKVLKIINFRLAFIAKVFEK